ncbi:MAG: diguanylate cyclase [Actinobacteria bacterium]|nr:diguanylate cyclase [Actinomycetota bacterium]MCB8997035.1 diguanylate cyclase [Actinomycetota bacterium]HRY11789.1 diguanylate cyclase [Candidatus Nanopelagicales bacterium]
MRQLDPGTMLDAVSAAVVLADDQGRVIRMNSYAHKVFRGRPTELREVGLESQAGEQTVRRMDGSSVTASVAVTVIDDGLSVLTVSEWDGHNEYARLDLNAFGVGTWDWHIPSGDLHFDRRWLEMLGYQQGELDYDLEAWERLVHPDDRDRVDEELRAHLAGRTPTYRCEYRCRHRDGHYVWVLDTGTVIERDATGRPLRASGIHLDITDRKRQDVEREELIAELERTRDRLKDLVRIDELTGLGNRRVLAEAMDRAWLGVVSRGANVGVLMVDLDGFKNHNDLHGHADADSVLRSVALAMSSVVRGRDTLVRFGGDEFVVVLPDAEPQVAAAAADRIRQAVAQSSPVTASVGVAVWVPGCGIHDPDGLFAAADRALYAAKAAGRDRAATWQEGATSVLQPG